LQDFRDLPPGDGGQAIDANLFSTTSWRATPQWDAIGFHQM
jgi:hypothetical protein